MRTKIALAALVVGLGVSSAPLSPAAAYCEPQPTTNGSSGCTNSCMETGRRYESLRAKLGTKVLPSYWDLFACPM